LKITDFGLSKQGL